MDEWMDGWKDTYIHNIYAYIRCDSKTFGATPHLPIKMLDWIFFSAFVLASISLQKHHTTTPTTTTNTWLCFCAQMCDVCTSHHDTLFSQGVLFFNFFLFFLGKSITFFLYQLISVRWKCLKTIEILLTIRQVQGRIRRIAALWTNLRINLVIPKL